MKRAVFAFAVLALGYVYCWGAGPPLCTEVPENCFVFESPGPYDGYCCVRRFNFITSRPPNSGGGIIEAKSTIPSSTGQHCGILRYAEYDYGTMTWFCGTNAAGAECGGLEALQSEAACVDTF